MIKNKYRYKVDDDGDYKVEIKYWYFPILWFHLTFKNSEESTLDFILFHRAEWKYV